MRLADYDIDTRFEATVASTRRITDPAVTEVREIVLDIDLGGLDIEAGQSVGVLAPGRAEFGQEHHFRLYTVADLPEKVADGKTRIPICVRRCSYVDGFSGEEYPGRASHYLCDLHEGDRVTLTGPYGLAFEVPSEPEANLILIGTGTGIAPFRALMKRLYFGTPQFDGQVLLFYGARTGLELLYMNDEQDDFTQYYDRDTFKAVTALSARPDWTDQVDWSGAMESRAGELWHLMSDSKTFVYVAGLEAIRDELDKVFARIAGSVEKWARRKTELEAGGRWVELLY